MFLFRPVYNQVSDLYYDPWRIPDACTLWQWKEETQKTILEEKVAKIKPLNVKACDKLNLLIIGPKAHGKSSLINAIASVSMQEKTTMSNAGSGQSSSDNVTTVYRQIKFPGLFDSFTVGDVKGLTKEVGASSNLLEDLKLLIKGHIKPGYKFDATKPIATYDSFYIDNPNTADMIHGVIIVFDITETYEIHAAHLNDIKDLTKKLHEMNIPISVMLTKVDRLCRRVAENIEYIYHSKKVLTAVETVEKELGVPKKNIHPIVNFEDEISFGWKSSLPLLVALRACLSMAKCHLYNEQQKKGNAEAEAKNK